MADRLSVYLDGNTGRKLNDIIRAQENLTLTHLSMSKAIQYCVLRTWRADFEDGLNADNWSEETRRAVEKWSPADDTRYGLARSFGLPPIDLDKTHGDDVTEAHE